MQKVLLLALAWRQSSTFGTALKAGVDTPAKLPVPEKRMPPYDLWGHTGLDIEIPEGVFPDEAWRDQKDELFDHPRHGFFASRHEGKRLHYRAHLPPEGTPVRAVVVWQHGIHGQSGFGMRCKDGRYLDMALRVRLLTARGIAVYAHDQLGHGFSEGTRFYIPDGDWTINRDDLASFARLAAAEHPAGTPLFLSGDSYGGCLAFHAAHVFQTASSDRAPAGFAGCLLNCPALDGDLPAWPVILLLRYVLKPLAPTWTPFFMPHPITAERIFKEEEPREFYTGQEYGLTNSGQPFCLGTATGLLAAMQEAQALFPTFSLPFHINHGSDDDGVPFHGSQRLFNECQTPEGDKELHIVPDGYHALYSQRDAEDTARHEMEWIEKRIRANS